MENQPNSQPSPDPDATQETTQPRGYFNRAQLDDVDEAVTVLAAARVRQTELAEQDITAVYLDGLKDAIQEAQTRITAAALAKDQAKTDTLEASASARDLIAALRRIQSSARQKNRMLAEDGDPTTNFPLDGYLIGVRITASRSVLLQSARTLIDRAITDALPGHRTPQQITDVNNILTAYENDETEQSAGNTEKGLVHLDRDALIELLNTRRAAVQFAADAIWPYTQESTRPIRTAFLLPATRPLAF
jgi:hypothetical protein